MVGVENSAVVGGRGRGVLDGKHLYKKVRGNKWIIKRGKLASIATRIIRGNVQGGGGGERKVLEEIDVEKIIIRMVLGHSGIGVCWEAQANVGLIEVNLRFRSRVVLWFMFLLWYECSPIRFGETRGR